MAARSKYLILGGLADRARRERLARVPAIAARELFSKSRHELIAETAYHRAARRGFQGGNPDEDWYEAEAEVEALLRRGRPF